MQRLRQEERALQVQVHHLVPAGFRELFKRCTPGRTGVVDEDVQVFLARQIGGHQAVHAYLGRHIGRQRHTVPQGREFRRCGITHRRFARRDVDPRTRLQVTLGDHSANAA